MQTIRNFLELGMLGYYSPRRLRCASKTNLESPLSDLNKYLDDCLKRKLIFFTGKGGVGKTALAWATAWQCQQQNKRVVVFSWSPFDPTGRKPLFPGIEALNVQTMDAFKEYALRLLKFEKVYKAAFDNHVFRTFVRAAPGIAETVVAGKIYQLVENGDYDLILVDLPSSGHALSFFKSPLGVQNMFRTGFVHRDAEKINELFQSESTRVDLVSIPEELAVTEVGQLKKNLSEIATLPFGFMHLNRCLPRFDLPRDWQSLGPNIQRCLDTYTSDLGEEHKHIEQLAGCGMAMVKHQRWPVENDEQLIQQLANAMETN